MHPDNPNPMLLLSRRQAIQRVAAAAALASAAEPLLEAQSGATGGAPHPTTKDDFVQLMTQLSNWNRWGKDDQMGAVNLITPAKRKQALATVKEGASYSMARTAELQEAVDNPAPIVRKMTRVDWMEEPLARAPSAAAAE